MLSRITENRVFHVYNRSFSTQSAFLHLSPCILAFFTTQASTTSLSPTTASLIPPCYSYCFFSSWSVLQGSNTFPTMCSSQTLVSPWLLNFLAMEIFTFQDFSRKKSISTKSTQKQAKVGKKAWSAQQCDVDHSIALPSQKLASLDFPI